MKIDATFKLVADSKVKYPQRYLKKYTKYREKWHGNPKEHIVERFPIHLDLESTSVCNLKCPFCFQSFNPPKYGYMSFELFKKCIDEGTGKGLCSIKLQYRGEPLLHPKIAEMVKYAKDKGVIEVMFNTNGLLLNEKIANQLIKAGLDKIIFSVDGYTKEEYEKNRVGSNWEVVLENIKRLQKLKKSYRTKFPVVRVQMVNVHKDDKEFDNEFHINSYIRFWKHIANHVGIEDMNDYHQNEDEEVIISETFQCPQPWQRLFVLWNGTVTLCCGDLYERMPLGDANKQSIESIWTSDKVNRIRTMMKGGESHLIPLCKVCGYRKTCIKNGT